MMHKCAIPGTVMADYTEPDMQIIPDAVKFACICVTPHIAALHSLSAMGDLLQGHWHADVVSKL